jgi:hypothetical protein
MSEQDKAVKADTAPVRIQLRRTKGWRMPANTVKVDRTTKWGNPFVIGERYPCHEGYVGGQECGYALIADNRDAVAAFRSWVEDESQPMNFDVLSGKSLACWCKLDTPCHADVLLDLANQPKSETP